MGFRPAKEVLSLVASEDPALLLEVLGFPGGPRRGREVLTTSKEPPHRQADVPPEAHTRATAKGVDFEGIQNATRSQPDALLTDSHIPFGWWHCRLSAPEGCRQSQSGRQQRGGKNARELNDARQISCWLRHESCGSRSARLFTSEIIATGVLERLRMDRKTDPLFAELLKK